MAEETYYYNREINFGSFLGCPVKLHSSFFLLVFIQIISSIRMFAFNGFYFLFVLILYGPILYITILMHETGHVLMAEKLGGEAKQIVLWPMGGYAICGVSPSAGVIGDLKIAIAGPLMQFPQMLFWFLCYTIASNADYEFFRPEIYLDIMFNGFSGFMQTLFCRAFFMNVFIFAFNFFIPAYPLDGGRCMAATLVLLGFSLKKAALITSIASMFVSILLLILGMVSFFAERNPNGLFTVLIAPYIFYSGKHLYDMAAAGREKEHPLFNRPCYDEREVTMEQAVQQHEDDDDYGEEDEEEGMELKKGSLA